MTPQEIYEYITDKIQGDGTNYTAQDDEALAFVQKAIKKQIPRKPDVDLLNIFTTKCSACGNLTNYVISANYCSACGQALDWSENENM